MARIKPTMSTTVPVELLHKIELEAEAHHYSRSLVVEKGVWLYFDVVQPEYEDRNRVLRRRNYDNDQCKESKVSRRLKARN